MQHNNIYVYTRMKIINSHYIPLPEPRWLIVDPVGAIYEQIGTLTVVEDSSKEKGNFGITTHSYPVVRHMGIDNAEEADDALLYHASLALADGRVLDDVEAKDCTQLCLSKHRVLTYLRFNALIFKFQTGKDFEDFYLEDFIDDLKTYAIKLIFPKEELQEITLTTFDGRELEGGSGVSMIMSDLTELLFMVPFWAYADKKGVHVKWDEIFMEFVNQARAYLKVNPKYRFHFKSSIDILNPLIDKLNKELNDYLERKEEEE